MGHRSKAPSSPNVNIYILLTVLSIYFTLSQCKLDQFAEISKHQLYWPLVFISFVRITQCINIFKRSLIDIVRRNYILVILRNVMVLP